VTIHGETNYGNIQMDLKIVNLPIDGNVGAFEETMSTLDDTSNYHLGPFIRIQAPKSKSPQAISGTAFTAIEELVASTNQAQRLTEFNTTQKHGEYQ
jgi:hypothetical protein